MKELKNFFYPKTIAVIGASNDLKKVGGILMHKLLKFEGEIIPINPNHKIVQEKIAYPNIKNVKKRIDFAIVVIPSESVKQILIECGKKKIKNVIIISAGFGEIGKIKEEKELTEIAKVYKINLLGPNCFGIANPEKNLDATFSNLSAKKGNIAFVSQSGALWSYISDYKIGFSKFISLGNMAGLNFADLIDYLNKDKKTKKIILYVEKLKEGKEFIKICKKSKKEIIAIKAGKSKEGREAAISHTGSLATDFKIYKGIFKQAKIKQLDSIGEALGIGKIEVIPDKKNKIIIVTNAGGAGTLITDRYIERGYKLVKPPIDILGTASSKDYKKTFDKIKKLKSYDVIITILTPQRMSEPEQTAREIVKLSKTKKVIAYFLGDRSVHKAKRILEENKIACYTKI